MRRYQAPPTWAAWAALNLHSISLLVKKFCAVLAAVTVDLLFAALKLVLLSGNIWHGIPLRKKKRQSALMSKSAKRTWLISKLTARARVLRHIRTDLYVLLFASRKVQRLSV